MSIANNTFLPLLGGGPYGTFGMGGTGFPVTQDAVSAQPETSVEPAQGIDRPNMPSAYGTGMYGPLAPYDGYAGPNPGIYGFPGSFGGFDPIPALTVPLMWQMRATNVIALTSFLLLSAPILTAGQSMEIVDDLGQPEQADAIKKAAEKDLLPVLARALPGACESPHFGNWLQEVVWGRRDDRVATQARTAPVEVRPVLPMEAMLHRDAQLRFVGYQIGNEYRDARYAFLCVNQPHLDPVRGYSRNQNALADWWRSRQSESNADKIERKASGIHMKIGVPNQDFQYRKPDGTTETVTALQMAQRIADQAARANVFTVPRFAFSKEAIQANPALAALEAITVQQFDWGNIGESLTAHLARLDRLDRNMIRAWYHGEREAVEGIHGTKAEAETHKAGGVLDCELMHASICRQWDDQVGRVWIATNFGPEWVGSIRTKPAPLSDPMQTFLQGIVNTLIAAKDSETSLNLDERGLLERTKTPIKSAEEVEKDRVQHEADKAKQDAANKAQMNGNGAMNGKGFGGTAKRAVRRLLSN